MFGAGSSSSRFLRRSACALPQSSALSPSCRHRRPPLRWHATGKSSSSSRSSEPLWSESFWSDNLKAFALGSAAGLVNALAGMGGALFMIPMMSSPFLRLSQHQAHGTSLFAVATTGVAGAWAYRDHIQHWEPTVAIALSGMITARLGARTTSRLSAPVLKRSLGVLMLVMAAAVPLKTFILEHYKGADDAVSHQSDALSESKKSSEMFSLFQRVAPWAVVGSLSGYLAGLFGIGGGILVVPALAVFTSHTHYEVLATSLLATSLPSMVGTWSHYRSGHLAMRVAPALAAGACLGAVLGGRLGQQTEESKLRMGFTGLLAVMGVRTLMKV